MSGAVTGLTLIRVEVHWILLVLQVAVVEFIVAAVGTILPAIVDLLFVTISDLKIMAITLAFVSPLSLLVDI